MKSDRNDLSSRTAVQYESSVKLIENIPNCFQIYLIRNGNLILSLHHENVYISGKGVLCLGNPSNCQTLFCNAQMDLLAFPPTLIHESDDFSRIKPTENFPNFRLFLEQPPYYNGVILLNETEYTWIEGNFNKICNETSVPKVRASLYYILEVLNEAFDKMIPSGKTAPLANDARRYIDSCFHQNITIETLCKALTTNRTTLSETFRKTYGISIVKYIQEKRIQHAKQLLAQTNLPVSEIAIQSGFQEQTYFSKSFHQATGIAPVAYRLKTKG